MERHVPSNHEAKLGGGSQCDFWANPIQFECHNHSLNPQEIKTAAALELLMPFSKKMGTV